MGLWGKFFVFVGSSWNFVSGYIKNVDTHHVSFSSKKTSNKKVITKKLLTNLYEMNIKFSRRACLFVSTGASCDAVLCPQAGQEGFLRQVGPVPHLLQSQRGRQVGCSGDGVCKIFLSLRFILYIGFFQSLSKKSPQH